MKRKLTYYRVYWKNGCVDEFLTGQYHSLMAHKDMKKAMREEEK